MASGRAETFAVLGATSLVGTPLLAQLAASGRRVIAYSRAPHADQPGVAWRLIGRAPTEPVDCWIGVAPIWTLSEHFALLEASDAKRLVQLSSTSQFTKSASSDPHETAIARRLADAEEQVIAWAAARGIAWTILRPTLIHGAGRDRNVAEIARFIARFGFFPLFGRAQGLRQPVAADDVARACLLAAQSTAARHRAYDIGGGEVLPYRQMVRRIFSAAGRQPITPTVPLLAFRLALTVLHLFPRYRGWTPAMAERMNLDMVFDNAPAARDFGYAPKGFEPQV
ncbi:MAG: NAD-dependent epimerase/dehydratase family protein [Devosia sp.]|nr:NAD-dependent epimerase/dehydratase family protein [Devosia sp.]